MGMSRRQRIIELLLETDVPLSPEDISRILKIDVRAVREDLKHIQFSIQRKGMRLAIIPQRCKKCGFVFKPSESLQSDLQTRTFATRFGRSLLSLQGRGPRSPRCETPSHTCSATFRHATSS